MLKKDKQELYIDRINLLFYKGLSEGKIMPFDDEFYSKLKNTYVSGLPAYIYIKYFKPILPPGKCYERSLYMFFCFKDALLVRGDHEDLKLEHGRSGAGHGWIEIGDYVYDATYLMRFDKKLYYEMFGCKKVKKYTHKQYQRINANYYDDVMSTSIEDFKLGGRKMLDLLSIIPLVESTAKLPGNEELLKDLNEFLSSIDYDEQAMYTEINNSINEVILTKKLCSN